jgi:hypothetical protein
VGRYGLRLALTALTGVAACGPRFQPRVLAPLDSAPAPQSVAPERYFFRGLPYGSEAYYGPLAVVLNKGFALSLTEGMTRKLSDFPYGVDAVVDALTDPGAAIERGGGWGTFVKQEMLPLSVRFDDVKWWTNYTGHLLEGGVHWRQLREWYQYHGIPLSGLLSGVTTMSASFLNEVYESTGGTQGSSGTVADLYFFDLAGIALFAVDPVAQFFSRTLHTTLWTGQASFVFPAVETDNNSSHVFFKLPVSPIDRTSLFLWLGVGGGLGLTLHGADDLDVSIGAGTDAKARWVDPVTGEEHASLTFGGGLWIDRAGSLLASVHVSEVAHRMVRINVYPGVLRWLGGEFGTWLTLSRDLEVRVGLSSRHSLGLGIGAGR